MEDLKTLIKIAHYYYYDGLTQEQIAEKMSLSRQKIYRLLKEVLKKGIVKIEIIDYKASNIEVERDLEETFGLKNAIVISEHDNERLLESLGLAAANYLKPYLEPDKIIGVGWGRTLRFVAGNINVQHNGISIVQIAGGASNIGIGNMQKEIITQSDEIVIMFSQHLGGTPYFLHAPVFVKNKETKKVLMEDQYIKNGFEMIGKCDISVLSIGGIGQDVTPFKEKYLDLEDLEELENEGAAGHMAFNYFDIEGQLIHTSLDERRIVASIEYLKKIPLVVGIGGGTDKEKAVLGALRGKFIDVLITNIDTANYLLKNK